MAYNKHATIPYYSKKKELQTMKQGTLHPICLMLQRYKQFCKPPNFVQKKRMCADKKKPPLVHTSGGLLALPTASKRLLHCQRIDCFTSRCSGIDSVRTSVHIEQIDCDRHYQHSQNDVQNFAPQWNAFACKRIL